MTSTDLFQQRDKVFGLVERWQAGKVEAPDNIACKMARLWATCKSIAPAGEVRQPGLVQPSQNVLSLLAG